MKFEFNKVPKFCISLKESVDRRKAVEKEFKANNIKVQFLQAVDKRDMIVPEISPKIHESHANGIMACAKSHLAVIRHAKTQGLPAVCIFEDDVVFCDDFLQRIKYIESLEKLDYDIFCLGGHYPDRHDWHIHHAEVTQWKHLFKVKRMGGTYAYILTDKTYDFILRNWWYGLGMDEFYANHVYHRFQTLAMTPFPCGHARSKSEITGRSDWQYENAEWFFNKSIPLDLT